MKKTCKNLGYENTDLVHSGADMVWLNIHWAPGDTYCYRCARAYAAIMQDREQALQQVSN